MNAPESKILLGFLSDRCLFARVWGSSFDFDKRIQYYVYTLYTTTCVTGVSVRAYAIQV
jgi:hypothetical protein